MGAVRSNSGVSIVPIDVGKTIMNHSPVITTNRCYHLWFLFMIVVPTYDQMGSFFRSYLEFTLHDSVIGNRNPFKIEDIFHPS